MRESYRPHHDLGLTDDDYIDELEEECAVTQKEVARLRGIEDALRAELETGRLDAIEQRAVHQRLARTAVAEKDKLMAQVVRLDSELEAAKAKIEQMKRGEECWVARPGEGTLECRHDNPCGYCARKRAEAERDEATALIPDLQGAIVDLTKALLHATSERDRLLPLARFAAALLEPSAIDSMDENVWDAAIETNLLVSNEGCTYANCSCEGSGECWIFAPGVRETMEELRRG